ncbi:GM18241 [Drosophila sechellia]|uniref:GM18241 n=1 Tax=Drosophila sechellia TaxID=7238 RepID=B4I2I3_DROSE|nr:GM18241 [Drosophila sechellia]
MELLSVGPQVLTFYPPYDDRQRRMVTLLNPTDRRVLFKLLLQVTSNAWLNYTVNPNTGRIGPYSSSEIIISLKSFDFNTDERYNHHFVIKSMFEPQDHKNGQTILAIFRDVSRRDISSNSLLVRLEAQPFPLDCHGLDSLCDFSKTSVNTELQLRQLYENCANRLEEAPAKQKTPSGSRHLSKIVIIGSLTLVVLTAFVQRKLMFETLMDTQYADIHFQ